MEFISSLNNNNNNKIDLFRFLYSKREKGTKQIYIQIFGM